jgi:primosomal replication protein N
MTASPVINPTLPEPSISTEPGSSQPAQHNLLRLSAQLIAIDPPRFTPAGIDVVSVLLSHQSVQAQGATEAPRRAELTLKAVAFADVARLLSRAPLGSGLEVEGFLANGSGRQAKQVQLQIERCKVS